MSVQLNKISNRYKVDKYLISLSVYPVARCGGDLQTGSPLTVSAEGRDLFDLKHQANDLVLSVMTDNGYSGECFVEMIATKNGGYCDSDEWWCTVDTVRKEIKLSRGTI